VTESLPQMDDGRPYITAELAFTQPAIMDMVRRQSGFWRQVINQDVWIAAEPGEIPVRIEVFDAA
jgi:hypothetical protein